MPEWIHKHCLVARIMLHLSDHEMLEVDGIGQQLVMHGIANLHTLALSRSLTSFSTRIKAALVSGVMAPLPKACTGQCALPGTVLYP